MNSQPTCPLCRSELDPKAHIEVPDADDPEHSYYWQYQGRNFGWWNYERQMSDQIEETYRRHLWTQRTTQQTDQESEDQESEDQESEEQDQESEEQDQESEEQEQEDDSTEQEEPACELLIGPNIYVVDVKEMVQYDKKYPDMRRRNIRRVSQLDKEETKGTAGLQNYYE